MKNINRFKIAVLTLTIVFLSCSSDEDNEVIPVEVTPDFQVIKHDEENTVMNDQEVFVFNTVGEGADLGFDVKNLTDTVSYFRIECTDLVNTDGSMFLFCWGVCLPGVVEGQIYPEGDEVIAINPGETQTSTGDHFQNINPGDGSTVMDFKFRFFQTDIDGVEIPEADDLTITYRYDPNAS